MLCIDAYKKTFGSELVLDIPYLELQPNIYWLQGENGSGKTTFLKSVAGLLSFEGQISVNDVSIRKQRMAYTAIVNYAAAEPQYPSFLTGNDLIRFYMGTKKGDPQTVSRIAAAFGMNDYLNNKVDAYSSGMTKKLSLLLAFIGTPKFILLDEPFTTLDTQAAQELSHLIQTSFSNGVSFCISSHHPVMMPHVSLVAKNKTLVTK